MTKEEIIRIAREVYGDANFEPESAIHIEFATRVAAAERERCAELCKKLNLTATPNSCAAAIRALP